MGGCYVGTKPYVSNGARAIVLLALCFCVFGGLRVLPMAALTGLMIMVAIGTFRWASLKL
jgi:SulP family sulfate permease